MGDVKDKGHESHGDDKEDNQQGQSDSFKCENSEEVK
jgi:hypothetical protein